MAKIDMRFQSFEPKLDTKTEKRMDDDIKTESVFGKRPYEGTIDTVEVNRQLMMIWHRVVEEYTETHLRVNSQLPKNAPALAPAQYCIADM